MQQSAMETDLVIESQGWEARDLNICLLLH